MISKKQTLPKSLTAMLAFYLVFILAFCTASFIFPPEVCPNLSMLLIAGTLFYGFQYLYAGIFGGLCILVIGFAVYVIAKEVFHAG